MIVEHISEDSNVTLTMSAVEAGVLLNYLSIGYTPLALAQASEILENQGIYAPSDNVQAHLEAIRVVLDDVEFALFPHLQEVDGEDGDFEVEFEPDFDMDELDEDDNDDEDEEVEETHTA